MKRIVLIDDDASILDVFKIVFERAGYEVIIFNNGDQILTNDFEEPDIFIIDKQLSGADGLDVCRHLKSRESKRSTPVIIFSASTHLRKFAKEAGADDFIEKPFKTKELLGLIERQLSKSLP